MLGASKAIISISYNFLMTITHFLIKKKLTAEILGQCDIDTTKSDKAKITSTQMMRK